MTACPGKKDLKLWSRVRLRSSDFPPAKPRSDSNPPPFPPPPRRSSGEAATAWSSAETLAHCTASCASGGTQSARSAARVDVLARLEDHKPPLPVVIHTFLPESADDPTGPKADAFLEKKGDTDFLKAVVAEVICKYYPERLDPASEGGSKKENKA